MTYGNGKTISKKYITDITTSHPQEHKISIVQQSLLQTEGKQQVSFFAFLFLGRQCHTSFHREH